MSVAGAYTDFHIDLGGTSVWYHMFDGRKVFLLIPPTPTNLDLYRCWTSSPSQAQVFFADLCDPAEVFVASLQPGQTLLIPSGWIHAVYTPVDSLVFGGNFLHSLAIRSQLQVYQLEQDTGVPQKFRFPGFERMLWYVLRWYAERIESAKAVPSVELEGLWLILHTLRRWLAEGSLVQRQSAPPELANIADPFLDRIQRLLESSGFSPSADRLNLHAVGAEHWRTVLLQNDAAGRQMDLLQLSHQLLDLLSRSNSLEAVRRLRRRRLLMRQRQLLLQPNLQARTDLIDSTRSSDTFEPPAGLEKSQASTNHSSGSVSVSSSSSGAIPSSSTVLKLKIYPKASSASSVQPLSVLRPEDHLTGAESSEIKVHPSVSGTQAIAVPASDWTVDDGHRRLQMATEKMAAAAANSFRELIVVDDDDDEDNDEGESEMAEEGYAPKSENPFAQGADLSKQPLRSMHDESSVKVLNPDLPAHTLTGRRMAVTIASRSPVDHKAIRSQNSESESNELVDADVELVSESHHRQSSQALTDPFAFLLGGQPVPRSIWPVELPPAHESLPADLQLPSSAVGRSRRTMTDQRNPLIALMLDSEDENSSGGEDDLDGTRKRKERPSVRNGSSSRRPRPNPGPATSPRDLDGSVSFVSKLVSAPPTSSASIPSESRMGIPPSKRLKPDPPCSEATTSANQESSTTAPKSARAPSAPPPKPLTVHQRLDKVLRALK
jgi:hypothetical protein